MDTNKSKGLKKRQKSAKQQRWHVCHRTVASPKSVVLAPQTARNDREGVLHVEVQVVHAPGAATARDVLHVQYCTPGSDVQMYIDQPSARLRAMVPPLNVYCFC